MATDDFLSIYNLALTTLPYTATYVIPQEVTLPNQCQLPPPTFNPPVLPPIPNVPTPIPHPFVGLTVVANPYIDIPQPGGGGGGGGGNLRPDFNCCGDDADGSSSAPAQVSNVTLGDVTLNSINFNGDDCDACCNNASSFWNNCGQTLQVSNPDDTHLVTIETESSTKISLSDYDGSSDILINATSSYIQVNADTSHYIISQASISEVWVEVKNGSNDAKLYAYQLDLSDGGSNEYNVDITTGDEYFSYDGTAWEVDLAGQSFSLNFSGTYISGNVTDTATLTFVDEGDSNQIVIDNSTPNITVSGSNGNSTYGSFSAEIYALSGSYIQLLGDGPEINIVGYDSSDNVNIDQNSMTLTSSSGGGGDYIKIEADQHRIWIVKDSDWEVKIDIADLIAASGSPPTKEVKFQEYYVNINGEVKKAMFLVSDTYSAT